ncbi:hypothetical protein BGZ90_004819 [Linnemannia elongata]|nr:hypothetical protein BGZ90_004819 [Linnemannia elongata]
MKRRKAHDEEIRRGRARKDWTLARILHTVDWRVAVHRADDLEEVEHLGKNDPMPATPSEHDTLYLEILDAELSIDELVALTAIPLDQFRASQGHAPPSRLNFYSINGKQKGEIFLTIAVVTLDQTATHDPQYEVRGISKLNSEHQSCVAK